MTTHANPAPQPFMGRPAKPPPAARAKRTAAAQPQPQPEKPSATTALVTIEHRPSPAIALPDTRTPTQRYLDEVAPASIVGRLIKFTKEGSFATADDGEPVSGEIDFLVLADETLVGWIRFHEDGSPPDRIQGLLYEGFTPPPREALGDADPAAWPIGISGGPADPWQHQMCLILQHRDTHELFTFATSSTTGRRAVGNLLKHYDRLATA
jgi:hypothetical protein